MPAQSADYIFERRHRHTHEINIILLQVILNKNEQAV